LDKEELEAAVAGKLAPGTRNWEVALRRAKLKENADAIMRTPTPSRPPPTPMTPGAMTPKSVTTAHSLHSLHSLASEASEAWYSPGETLILLDWDDTLCPTYCCSKLLQKATLSATEEEALCRHQEAVIKFLKAAREHGHVTIVTMAMKSWVTASAAKLMPKLPDVLKELQIDVVSARESLAQRLRRSAFSDDRDPAQFIKMKAMDQVIKQFYKPDSRLSTQARSWKNIVSIGDSSAERLALQDLVFRRMQRSHHGVWKECRCKTILLLENPTLDKLTKEMRMMQAALPPVARYDGDMHIDSTEEDLDLVFCD